MASVLTKAVKQNNIVEKKNYTLKDKVKCKLTHLALPNFLWVLLLKLLMSRIKPLGSLCLRYNMSYCLASHLI